MATVYLDIRTTKAVYRLHLVTDRAQVLARHPLDEPKLKRVGVLKLIDHHNLESRLISGRHLRSPFKKFDRFRLQILEVQHTGRLLQLPIPPSIGDHQGAKLFSVRPYHPRGRPGRQC